MIPKIIHFIWIGDNPMPSLVVKCLASVKEYLPDYQLMIWNDESSQVVYDLYPYAKQAREAKIYAFASDVIRLYALKEYGGIYVDADLEIFKSLDPFLKHRFFTGFQDDKIAVASIIGSEKQGAFVTKVLSQFEGRAFLDEKGNKDFTTINQFIHDMLLKEGIKVKQENQLLDNGIAIYKKEIFSPYHPKHGGEPTDESFTMHHYSGSWIEFKKASKKRKKQMRSYVNLAVAIILVAVIVAVNY